MDEERTSDTEETHGSQSAPGDASNQNGEEPSAPTGGDSSAHRKSSEPDEDEGGSGEQSQATGNPANAG